MKLNSGFVTTMLAMFSVMNVDLIPRSEIKGEHVRLMHQNMEPKAQELIAELAGVADSTMEPVTLLTEDKGFLEAGLWDLTPDERIIISRIYGSQGREIEITPCGIVVSPNQAALQKRRKLIAQQYQVLVQSLLSISLA